MAHSLPTCFSAVGFPLVGGPAGTMEGGRQSEIAKAILSTKNVPYVVAAPLLIQVMGEGGEQGQGRRGNAWAGAAPLRLQLR